MKKKKELQKYEILEIPFFPSITTLSGNWAGNTEQQQASSLVIQKFKSYFKPSRTFYLQ